ncbi:hypothetical protein B5M47_01465 [candidate division CPR3 bacterium 4484_211]|uniref:Triosephosphate isomerase n=1 Tax=candidate division CPR3 bacterium 4484_211 TaxID=1968527 RepID=A0A1W9NYI2_UNCC3|nr:MAG: hypothetical protein B5M47_01465 [candidate division CPR3 bacterium 4484_211]
MLVIANWKLHFDYQEARKWVQNFAGSVKGTGLPEVVIAPSFLLVPALKKELAARDLKVKIGAQTVSSFEQGSYTGEVSARQLSEWVNYVIIGHSERRKYFGETDKDVVEKVRRALRHQITPVICVSELSQVDCLVREDFKNKNLVVAYEPLFAIGSGRPDTPQNISLVVDKICDRLERRVRVLYGGSVSADNAAGILKQGNVDGFLVGRASLDPVGFAELVKTLVRC